MPIRLIDVPGLVRGAHLGKGLGSQFLDELNQADALIHIVDCAGATNDKGEPCEPGTNDPGEDIKFLEYELDMWFLRILKKGWGKFARTIQQEKLDITKALAKQLSGLKVTESMVKEAIKRLRPDPTTWSENDLALLASDLRKKAKPMIIAANKIDLPHADRNFKRLQQQFQYPIVPCSADAELALREAAKKDMISYVPGGTDINLKGSLSEPQKKALEYIKSRVLDYYKSTGVQDVLNYAVFQLLKFLAIFPGGVGKLTDKEGRCLPDCYLMPDKSTALDFAYKLHQDLGDHFVRAINVRRKAVIGRDYILQNRDVIEIKTSK